VSRLLWAGLGAAGGIYAYRRGNQVWEEAKERGFAGNASVLASTASAVLNHSKHALAQAQATKDAEIAEARIAQILSNNPTMATASGPIRDQDIRDGVSVADPQYLEPSLGRRASARLIQVGRATAGPVRQRYSA
jgi:hypothetical protein